MKDHFLEMKFGMVIKDHLEIMVVDHLEMKFGMGRRPFGMGMKGYTMRQNKDVFELFHNFDIPLNYLNITAMKSNPKTKKKNLIYKGKIDYFRVFSIIYENFKHVFILSHRLFYRNQETVAHIEGRDNSRLDDHNIWTPDPP